MATLKINDLSVGDWVEFHRTRGIYIAPPLFDHANAQVIGTHRGAEVSLLVDGKREFIAIPLSAIRPIPITAEILENNGWRVIEKEVLGDEYEYDGEKRVWDDYSIDICETKPGVFWYSWGIEYYMWRLEYVHQLQHLIRLAGVDKEINL